MKKIITALVLAAAPALAPAADMLVSAAWLKENLKDPKLVLFHVGTKPEFDQEHIRGAQHVLPQTLSIPHAESTLAVQLLPEAALRAKLESLGVSDDSRVVVYFGSNMVSPATRVYFSLDAAGLGDRTSFLDGGMPAWKAMGGDVTTETVTRPSGKITLKARPELVATLDDVRRAVDKKDARVIDARLPEFFDGTSAGSMPRAGRIPGARNLPFRNLTTTDLVLKSDAELTSLFKEAGVYKGDSMVTYCHLGQQATLVYFAAKRIGIKATMFDGSWDEWSRRTDLPIEPAPVK